MCEIPSILLKVYAAPCRLNGLSALSPSRPPLPTYRAAVPTLHERVTFQDEYKPSERAPSSSRKIPKDYSRLTGNKVPVPETDSTIKARLGASTRRPTLVAHAPRSLTTAPRDTSLVNLRRRSVKEEYEAAGVSRPPKHPGDRPMSAPAGGSRTTPSTAYHTRNRFTYR